MIVVSDAVQELLATLSVAAITQSDLTLALELHFKDYEDAVQNASAMANGIESIVTRNVSDFDRSSLDIYTPEQFIETHDGLFNDL